MWKSIYSLKRIIKAISFRSIDHPRVSWWKPSVAADSESEQAQIEVFRISIFYSDEDVSCLGLNGAGQPHLSALLQNMHKKPISELPKTDKTRIELKSKSAKEFISSFGTGLMVRKITFNLDRKIVHDSFKMKHLVICQNYIQEKRKFMSSLSNLICLSVSDLRADWECCMMLIVVVSERKQPVTGVWPRHKNC